MGDKFIYEGYIVGCDSRTHPDYRRKVKFRETKTMWITEIGERFSKKRLHTVGMEWPLYRIESEPVLIETNEAD